MYQNDIFATKTGVVMQSLDNESAKMSIVITEVHLNAGRVAHGGVVFLLCDIAMAAIANQLQYLSVSIQSDIRFLAASHLGDTLTAVAEPVFGRKSMFNCRVSVTNQNGEMIAVAEGMFHTKKID